MSGIWKTSISSTIRRLSSRRGMALAVALMWLGTIMVMGTGLVSFTTSGTIRASNEESRAVALNAADAALEDEYNELWKDFRITQRFDVVDSQCEGASRNTPKMIRTGSLAGGGRYWAWVEDYQELDNWRRQVTVVAVGWDDRNGNGQLNPGESPRALRTQILLALDRSQVFDYAYFVNNYGWMNGFSSSQLIVNGDMRANGDFNFSGGTPTINGSVYACRNDKLIPPASGIVNITPTQWSNSYYASAAPSVARPAYSTSAMGTKGSDEYEIWRDLTYDHEATIVRGRPSGTVVGDVNGIRNYSGDILDPDPTGEVLMPDLSDISYYEQLSRNYVDEKQTYLDGTANPRYGEEAYVEVWNSSTNQYQRVTTNGVYDGSLVLIGTSTYPVRIHGPVTVTGDVIIKGVVEGQSTLYAARNVHIVGDIKYKNKPDFRGTDAHAVDQANEKKDMLGLAARGSVIMGNTKTLSSTALKYMTPPFTKARYDEHGNIIPAYNAKEVDYTGRMRYQPIIGDDYINAISEPVNEINCVLYTNFLGGGDIGKSGTGVTFNGSIISRDEAMVLYSLPLRMNYDNRLRQRLDINQPLIDLNLPLSPSFSSLAWDEVDPEDLL